MDSRHSASDGEREVVLIVFGSKYGQTEKIATRIADVLAEEGQEAELWRVGVGSPEAPIGSYEGIMVGSPI